MIKCDLIMPVWNELEVTRASFESLVKNTERFYRLIVIDNGSDLPTQKYLEDAKSLFPEYKLVRLEKNLGFVKATNEGLKVANAEYICLVNNDVIFAKGWLSEMIKVMADRKIGVLNPESNNWGEWPNDVSIEQYAETLSARNGEWQESGYCIGFCMMFRKEIFDKVGYLDETYGTGYLEETDFCRRVQKLGYYCGIAKGAYVYHIGAQTFKKLNDHRLQYENNLKIFNRKWGKSLRIAYILNGCKARKEETSAIILAALRDFHSLTIYTRSIKASKSCIPDHASVRLREIKGLFFYSNVFLCIMARQLKSKKNKRFDIIILEQPLAQIPFNVLGYLSRCVVKIKPNLKEAQSTWLKAKSSNMDNF